MDKLKYHVSVIIAIVGIFLTSGCASSMMMKTTPLEAPDDQHAMVTFLRPTTFGGSIQFGIWDSENFVGILSADKQIQYVTTPGEHIFLGRAENWSYVKADLEGGKQYYILGRVFPGIWRARIAFDPVKKDDGTTQAELDKWLARTDLTTIILEKLDGYVEPRIPDVEEAIRNFKAGNVKYEVLNADDYR